MHLIDLSNDRENMAYIGEKPWHGLGFEMPENATISEWQQAAGLEWRVEENALKVEQLQAEPTPGIENFKALTRSDTHSVLNVVKNRYQVVQPEHLLNFFGELQVKTGITMETLGSLNSGKIIWGLGRTGRDLSLSEEDEMKEFVLLATSYDYTMATIVKRTAIRVVCYNTLQFAVESGNNFDIRGSHAGAFNFAHAQDLVLGVKQDQEGADSFQANNTKLADTKVTEADAIKYFLNLLYPNKTPEEWESNRVQKKMAKVINIFRSAPGQQLDTANNTAWGLVNAVTYLVDHQMGRTTDSRLRSAFFQNGAALKKQAYASALKLAA